MLSLIQYFDIDPESNASVTVYCDNVSAILRVETPLRKCGTRHRLILEYDLSRKLQWCIEKLRLNVDPEHVKGKQDNGSPVDYLPYPAHMKITCEELAGDYLSGISRPGPTFWNFRDYAPCFHYFSAALIIDDQVLTTSMEQQVRLATIGAALCSHIIKREKWTTQIFDSINWDSVATTMDK